MHKKLMATAVAASTLGGAAAGATLLAPGFAGAQDGTDTEAESPSPEQEQIRPEPGERIRAALQGLVDNGTLTDSQVDAVIEALADARPEGFEGRRGPGHRGHGLRGALGEGGADIAGLLDMEPTDVRDALREGATIADLAAQQGVDVDTIVDAIVDAAVERVDGALESGRIDQEKADEILANAEERAEAMVNGELERPRFRDGADDDTADA